MLELVLRVEGYLRLYDPSHIKHLSNPYRARGFLKAVLKHALLIEGVELPKGRVKGIVRYVDYPESDRVKYIRIHASPFAQFFGAPVKNCQWYGVSVADECEALLLLNNPARIIVNVEVPESEIVEYVQGVRDDVSMTSNDNVHQMVLVRFAGPVVVRARVALLPFDAFRVPGWVLPRYPSAETTYAGAYQALLDLLVRRISDVINMYHMSMFPGRSFHRLVVESADVKPLPDPPDPPEHYRKLEPVFQRLLEIVTRAQSRGRRNAFPRF